MAVRDWNTLRQVAQQGYSDGIVCLATIEIVERLNRPSTHGPMDEVDAGRVAVLVRDGMLTRMHLFLCRAFAPCRHDDDLHLRAAIEFLKEPGRLDEGTWPERRNDLAETIRLFDQADADPRLVGLNHMRNKLIAHMAQYDESVPRPRYNDLFGFARQTALIWERLSFGAGTVMIEIDHQIDAYRESADAFWAHWEEQPE